MRTVTTHPDTELGPAEFNRLVRVVVDRVSKRIADEIEARRTANDQPGDGTVGADRDVPLEFDRVEQELLAGGWIAEELARLDQARLHAGSPVLTRPASQAVRLRALADLYGMGPLQPWWDDLDGRLSTSNVKYLKTTNQIEIEWVDWGPYSSTTAGYTYTVSFKVTLNASGLIQVHYGP